MSVSINVGIFTDAAGNTNANASNMTFKLTSKRRTVHISTNVTDATSSYIPVWIRTEVPVWPDISESDIHVLHARMSKFRRINSTTYSFLLQPPLKYSNHSGMVCTGRNELGRNEPVSLVWCEEQCNLKSDCVSFEYYEAARRCQLSTSCTEEHMVEFTGWLLYIKLSTVQPASKPLTVNLNSHRWRSHYNERFEAMTFSWYPDTDSPVLNLHTPSLEIPVRRKSHSKHEHLK